MIYFKVNISTFAIEQIYVFLFFNKSPYENKA